MSQENLERLRQGLDAFNRGDRATWRALCDPEVENVPPRDWPESESIRGRDAVWDFFVEGQGPWGDGSSPFEYVELMDAGDRIVAHLRREVQGKASGASVAWSYWQVGTFDDGKLIRIEWFADRAEALEAAGGLRG